MENIFKRLLSLAIALVMIVSMIPGNALSVFAAEEDSVIDTEAELTTALAAGGTVTLGGDIEVATMIEIPAGVTATLDLNGHNITSVYQENSTSKHIYPLSNYGTLTIEDSVGTGSITGRGIYNQSGATITVDGAKIVAQDWNGGAGIWCYGATSKVYLNDATIIGYTGVVSSEGYLEINGGTYTCYSGVMDDGTLVSPTYNIRAYNGLKITDGAFTSRHGVISVSGGEAVIEDGSYTIEFTGATTSNVVYVSGSGDLTINGGEFISDNTANKADSGAAVLVFGTTAAVEINDGTFVGMNGMVSINDNTVINGGSFETVWDYNHYGKIDAAVTEGATITVAGTTYTKTENGLEEVTIAQVGTEAELVAALANGGDIQLTTDITTTAALNLAGVTATIDLKGYTLKLGAGDNKLIDETNLTIKNGKINIDDVVVKGNALICLDEYEETLVTTLTLQNVDLSGEDYSSAYGIFYIGDSSVLNVEGGEWTLTNDLFNAGGVFKADDAKATLNIDGTTIVAHNVRRLVTYANSTIENATITITGDADGVDAEMEHGFNRSPLTITDSTITMENLVGRGITAEQGAVTITNSTVSITNAQEATIDVRNGQTVTVDANSTVTVDAAPTITGGTIVGTVKVPASGTITSCLVNLSDPAETFISSEIQNLNATESVVIKLYSGETQIATTTLQKPEYYVMATLGVKIIITGASSSWKTEWAEGMPRADVVPDKVTLYVDGTEMNSATVPMISTDGEKAVNWADVPGVNSAAPTGSVTPAYTKEVDGYVRVWGEGGGNASESYELKLYAGETLIATTTLNNIGGIIDGDVYVTWNFYYPQSNDGYWTTTWEEGHPNSTAQPTKVVLYIDGEAVAENVAKMSAPDDLNKVVWEDLGGVEYIVTGLEGSGTAEDPYLIGNLEELKWFRDTVNTYTSDGSNQFKGKYVKLTADIDLDGENWEPIGTNSVGDHMAFLGTFDGDGHTISNLYINADGDHLGFFARVGSYTEGLTPTVKNITFKNVDVSSNTTTGHGGSYVGGVIANAGGNSVVSGITVTGDVYVVGYGYVGGIVGHGYPDIDDCHVAANDGSYLQCYYWCGGGIIGYAGEGGTPITNCSVSGLDIWSAYGGAAAIAGLLQDGNKLENVSASNVEITSNSDYIMGYIAGNGEASTMTNITATNVTATAKGQPITSTDAVATVDGTIYFDLHSAMAAAQAGQTITLLKDVTLTDSICIDKSLTIDGNGKTITSSNNRVIKINTVSNGAEAVVLKNVTVTSTASGGRCVQLAGSALKELTLDTVTLTATNGATQPITLSEQNSKELLKVTIKDSTVTASNNNAYALIAFCPIDATIVDSTLSGFAALYFKGNYDNTGVYSSEGSKVAVTDSTLTGTNVQNGNNSFSVISFEAGNIDLTVTGGSINAAATGEAANSILGAKNGITGITATLDTELNVGENCGYFGMGTGINNQQISVRAEYADDLNALGYAFKTSATEGMIAITGFAVAKIGNTPYATLAEAFTAAQDGDEVVILDAGTYALSTSGKDITITGAVDGVEFTNIGAKNMNGASVTFNNVTFTYGNENYKGLQHAGNLVYNNCTINGQVFLYGESETFNNCTFNQTSSDAYNVWTYGAKEVAFDECTFNSAGKSVLVYNEGACATDMTVTGCTFVASTAVEGKAAIEIDTSLMPDGTDIAITNSTATGFAAGSVSGNTLWNDKKDQTDLTVTVDGTQVWPIPELPTATVTEIDNKELNFALNFKADEPTDAQLAYYGDWYADFELTFNKDVTMNANGGADGYLSGQYDAWSENWVNVPFENVTLKANEPLKIMEYASQMMGQSGLKLTYNDVASFVKDFNCGVYLTPEYIAANPDLEITLVLKMYNPADETESYVIGQTYNFTVPELPTATVTEIENEDLTFALNFKADEPTDEQLAYYGDWYADFELTFNKDVTMNANGGADGYLSGQYDAWSENWVNVPFEDVTLSAGQSLKIMEYASQMMGQSGLKLTYNDVASFVKDFNCGVYLTPEYIAANPDLEITLVLKMYNPADETESYVIGETYNFTADSLGYVAYNVETGKLYTMADEALLEAAEGQTVILLKDTDGYRHVTVFEGITFDVNGFVLGTDYFTSFGDTVDNSEANTGAVNSKRMLIEPDNAQVTVKTDKGYQFIEIIGFNQRITNNNARFEFQPIFEEAAHDMLDEGVAVSGVTIQVDVSWKDGEHTRTQQFKFSDEFVNGFIAAYRGTDANGNHLGYSQAFFLELTNAADYSEVTYSCYVISDTGVSEYAPDINN